MSSLPPTGSAPPFPRAARPMNFVLTIGSGRPDSPVCRASHREDQSNWKHGLIDCQRSAGGLDCPRAWSVLLASEPICSLRVQTPGETICWPTDNLSVHSGIRKTPSSFGVIRPTFAKTRYSLPTSVQKPMQSELPSLVWRTIRRPTRPFQTSDMASVARNRRGTGTLRSFAIGAQHTAPRQ